MIQKLLALSLIAGLLFGTAYAGETSSNTTGTSGEFSAIQEYNFDLKAVADGGKIKLSWTAFPEEKDFKWYKLAYSSTKENPSYPEDTAHFIGEKREQTMGEFWTKEKMLYVRLCAITHNNERFCSGVKKVMLNQETIKTETPAVCTKEYVPVCGKKDGVYIMYSNNCMREAAGAYKSDTKYCENVSTPIKETPGSTPTPSQPIMKKADTLVLTFTKKLEEKGYNNEKIAQTLSEVAAKLEPLKSQEKYKLLIPYIQKKLLEAKAKYEESFGDIESIFGEY